MGYVGVYFDLPEMTNLTELILKFSPDLNYSSFQQKKRIIFVDCFLFFYISCLDGSQCLSSLVDDFEKAQLFPSCNTVHNIPI